MTTEKRKRRTYTEDFKRDAVALVTEQGYSVAEAARSLDVGENQIRRWRQKFEQESAEGAECDGARRTGTAAQREPPAADGERNLKKSQCVLREGNEVKYAFIRDHAKRWPVVHMCRLLDVKRSSYYDWRKRPAKVIPADELALRRRMKALFKASRESLGSRRMAKQLRAEGFEIGRERTRKLMKALASAGQAEA